MVDDHHERLIAQGLREGRADAWEALYDVYAERVWRAIARLLGPNASDVADVVQETMLAAARSARSYDPSRGSLWAWLWGIAHNQVALHRRKHDRRLRLAHAVATQAANNDKTVQDQSASELAELVRETLATLSAEYALLLTSRYLDGDSVAAIAGRERSTEVAIRSKLARAREAFREAFARFKEHVS